MTVTPIDALRAFSRASGSAFQHLNMQRHVRRSLSNEANYKAFVLSILNFAVARAAVELTKTDEEANALLQELVGETPTAKAE